MKLHSIHLHLAIFIHMTKYFFDIRIEVYCIVGNFWWYKISQKCLQTLQKFFFAILSFVLNLATQRCSEDKKQTHASMAESFYKIVLTAAVGEKQACQKKIQPLQYWLQHIRNVCCEWYSYTQLLPISAYPTTSLLCQLLLLKPVVIGLTYK